MTLPIVIEKLKLFNEKAEKLQRSSFLKKIVEMNSGFTIQFENKNEGTLIKTEIREPDEESIESFVLTYRLFIQNKDDISFRNMENVYGSLPLENKYLNEFIEARKRLNEILNSTTSVTINNHRVTIREVHNMFIYGNLAHVDEKDVNRKRYLRSKENPLIHTVFTNSFNITLVRVMNEILSVKRLNEEVLKILNERKINC